MRIRALAVAALMAIQFDAAGTAQQPAPAGQPALTGPLIAPVLRLDGVWAGVGYLDEEKLAAQLQTMPEGEAKTSLITKASLFLSLVAAMEFKPDGSLETELEITGTDGKVLREPAVGRWTLVEARENRALVELVERLPDETERTSRRLLQFYEDGEHLAMLMETDAALQEFNPLVIMARIPAGSVAQLPPNSSDPGATPIGR
jgi:hypothetical protein